MGGPKALNTSARIGNEMLATVRLQPERIREDRERIGLLGKIRDGVEAALVEQHIDPLAIRN